MQKTPQHIRERVLVDYIEVGMNAHQLALKHKLSPHTTIAIIKRYNREKNATKVPDPPPISVTIKPDKVEPKSVMVQKDKPLSTADVKKEIGINALMVVDLALKAMVQMLEMCNYSSLTPAQLTQFMNSAAPYVLAKPDAKQQEESKKDVYKLFKEHISTKQNAN